MKTTIWEGTVDNQNLSGVENGNIQPMRVVEDEDGRLMTEFVGSKFTDETETAVEYSSDWHADYQMRFREMEPPPADDLQKRMIDQKLLDA